MKNSNIPTQMTHYFLRITRGIFSTKPLVDIDKSESFLTGILGTQVFSRMAVQEKIIAIGKLISVFHRDHGIIPEKLAEAVVRFNTKLNSNLRKEFLSQYEVKRSVHQKMLTLIKSNSMRVKLVRSIAFILALTAICYMLSVILYIEVIDPTVVQKYNL